MLTYADLLLDTLGALCGLYYQQMRPQATSACGLQLLVYAAFSY
jgi:hypothetical protein